MADIKLRELKKGTIKTLDRAAVGAEKIKNVQTKTREVALDSERHDKTSPQVYATDNISQAVRSSSEKTFEKANLIGRKSIIETKKNFIKMRNSKTVLQSRDIRRGSFLKESSKVEPAIKGLSQRKNTGVSSVRISKRAKEGARKHAIKTAKNTRKKGSNIAKAGKKTAKGIAKAVRKAASAVKALVTAVIALGWIAVVIIVICCLFGAAFYFFGDSSSASFEPVSPEVESYTPVISKYAKKYGIPEYTELIKAVMMQESGGKGNDPMQASECGYNKKYPRKPNGITDPEYSVQCGVQNLAACLKEAKCKNPLDMDRIRLALQGYNYGNGYISWAIKRDKGYTVENADVFSDEQAKKHGWKSYGDKQYVAHVLRYYPYGSYNYGIGNGKITQVAAKQIGNTGGDKFWRWYGFKSHVHWCACFVSWCADQCGYIKSGTIPKFSLVSDGINWFKEKKQWQKRGYKPAAGDIIFFDWENDGKADHVGIVEKCDGKTVYTIEGNSSNICRRRNYSVNSIVVFGYGVPKY